jgi:Tol biopolymer transport system component
MKRVMSLVVILGAVWGVAIPASVHAAPTGRIVTTGFGNTAGIFSMLPDGTDVQLLYSIPQDWAVGGIDAAPDGSVIAMTFLPGEKGHIYVMNADGSGLVQVSAGGDDFDPSISPDASSLVFSRYANSRSDLYSVNTDGSNQTRLTQAGEPQATFPSWSPDGSQIAFFRLGHKRQSLVLTDVAGTTFDTILREPRRAGQFFTLEWSPDSSTLVFGQYNSDYTNSDLWTIGADGSGLTRLTHSAVVQETDPSYSPDGTRIACSGAGRYEAWADVFVLDADGSNRQRIELVRDQIHVSWGG